MGREPRRSRGRHRYWSSWAQLSGGQTDSLRGYSPGSQQEQDWGRHPLHPVPDVILGGAASQFPVQVSGSRTGNTLRVKVTPFSDNTLGHYGTGYLNNGSGVAVTGRYQLDQNGVEIAHGSALTGVVTVKKLSPKPSVLRLVLTAGRSGKPYRLSPGSRKPWVKIDLSAPKGTASASFAQLFRRLQNSNFTNYAQMLTLANNARVVGTQTVDGCPLPSTQPPSMPLRGERRCPLAPVRPWPRNCRL